MRASDGRLESDTTIDAGFTLITSVDWKPTLRAPVAGPDVRVVRGVVTDSGLRPVARATVSIAGLQSVVTDDSGWFRLRLPNRGEAVLELKRVAFAPTRFGLPAGGDTSISITLLQSIQQLERMNVKDAAPSSANLRGFDERLRRRARGITFGTFITAEQIERRSPAKVTQLFFDVPGIKMLKVHPLFERYAIFGTSRTMAGGPSACPATVYLDGIRLLEGGDIIKLKDPETGKPVREAGVAIDDLVSPSQIAGIEVYRSATDAPAQYQLLNGTCVVVLIWTK